jgi:hypothetical protein
MFNLSMVAKNFGMVYLLRLEKVGLTVQSHQYLTKNLYFNALIF